jgi:small-conductance mechanosensitive channel
MSAPPSWRLPVLLAILVAGLLGLLAGPGRAQTAEMEDAAFATQVAGWQKTLDKAGSVLVRPNLSAADYEGIHTSLSEVFDRARQAAAAAGDTVATTRQLLEALGKPPAEGAPAEADSITSERERLEETLSRFDARVRQSDLVATRADILLRTANDRRINQFAETLFLRGVSPLAAATFAQVPTETQFLLDRVQSAIHTAAAAGLPTHGQTLQTAVLGGLALVLLVLARHHLGRRFGRRAAVAEPSYRQRVMAGVVDGLIGALFPVLLVLAVAWEAQDGFRGLSPITVLAVMVRAAAAGLIATALLIGLGRALISSRHPAWRVFRIEDAAARRLALRLTLLAPVLALAGTVLGFLEVALVPPELHAVASFAAKALGALALLALLPNRLWRAQAEPDAPPPGTLVPGFRGLTALVTVAVLGLAALRFHNFSLYVAELFLAGTAITGLLFLLRGIGHELVELVVSRPARRLEQVRRAVFHSEHDVRIFQFLATALIDLLLLALGLVLVLPLSGIAWSEVQAWFTLFLRGVRVGEVTLSPVDIVSGVLLVVAIMACTRFLQRLLDDRVLQHLQIDRGVRHSIRTGIGYFGALLAILVGVSTVGLNLSNLALIAGALSVGIGFGLQAIVSNFVAGLILLVERPIKVGDWIVIGEHEGVVKRISVRATEIQTFQHASVIIPNSELIAKAVKNWTYKDKFGRIDIAVGVAYEADAEKARDVLLECVRQDPRVATLPPANVVFRNFGDSALEFELRCFVSDIETYRVVGTDLRFAILKAFRAAGIDMPYPQRSVTSPQLEKLARVIEQRLPAAGSDASV